MFVVVWIEPSSTTGQSRFPGDVLVYDVDIRIFCPSSTVFIFNNLTRLLYVFTINS